ncbi:hypothetical protein WA026_021715 [Henosepilachna vigintioctopunctata]|uniref:Pseudouridylate synthase 1 homolog n=1 Tax=Henosepilachna vigintioctopunctata TaxID=420089 RepID=A0AAW1TWX2_9CUCU
MLTKIFKNILISHYKPFFSSIGLIHMEPQTKIRYNGKTKKRQWQDRKSDDAKKLKINTTSGDSNNVGEKIKRKKFAMLLGYCGVDYYGMQRNPKMQTIEEELLKALFKVNVITEESFNVVQNMQFQRAARTDKGVSAVRQVVSLKLSEKVDIDAINKELPEVIRVFGVKKVTKGFNSKTNCSGRTYSYTLPTVSFADKDATVEQNGYRVDNETFDNVNRVLKMFVGTKNFHNFTSKKSPQDPSANRYIKSFVCDRPFVWNDVEFAILKVEGQSFMLHQIRKMVALMLAIVRNHAHESLLTQAFSSDKVNIPRAPGLGLLLEFVHYDRYNERYGKDGMHEKLDFKEFDSEVEAFKNKYILPIITNKEITEKEMIIWLSKLNLHRYDDVEEKDRKDEKYENDEKDDDENSDEEINSEKMQSIM